MSNLASKARYIAPYEFIINRSIEEWDIEKANISVLRDTNFFTEEQYEQYRVMDKKQREVAIGYLIKENPHVYKVISSGIQEAREIFFKKYNLEDEDILYIDNDSLTVIKRYKDTRKDPIQIAKHTKFRLKNTYTSFYKIFFIDLLYFNNNIEEHYRLKNVNQEFIESRHSGLFLDLILSIAYSAQSDILSTLQFINEIYKKYCNKELDPGFYREFNSTNKYKINISNFSMYYADTVSSLHDVDISFNASILRLFYKILLKDYYMKLRGRK